jgi:thioredoxin 2
MEIGTAADFDRLVSRASIPVVVDFWAPWCGPCRMVAPELVKVAARAAGRFLVVKVNTDAVPELGQRFGIRSIPTMAVFAEGREAARTSGARPAADIEAFVAQAAAPHEPTQGLSATPEFSGFQVRPSWRCHVADERGGGDDCGSR